MASSSVKNKKGSQNPQETKSIRWHLKIYRNEYFKGLFYLSGIVGGLISIFQYINNIKAVFNSKNSELLTVIYFYFIIILFLLGAVFWYDKHLRFKKIESDGLKDLEFSNERLRIDTLYESVLNAIHCCIHHYRNYYFRFLGETLPDHKEFFRELYNEIKPVVQKLLNSTNFEFTIKLLHSEDEIYTEFRSNVNRYSDTRESINEDHCFEHFKCQEENNKKYLIIPDIEHHNKIKPSVSSKKLAQQSKGKYKSLFVVPLVINTPDITFEVKKSFVFSQNRCIIGFMKFDSNSKKMFNSLVDWHNEVENTYGMLNLFFFFADLMACYCYQLNISGIQSVITSEVI